MANPTEQASQGCVALLNLIVSAVILFILVFILMPGFIDLPEWAEDLRKNKHFRNLLLDILQSLKNLKDFKGSPIL
jgi:ABC-type transport system involved in cytochrome bd biosynthesis fused ATPase/permease subunit